MPRLSSAFLSNERGKTATAWMDLNGVRFHVAWWYNEAFQTALASEEKPVNAFEHLLLDWEHLENDDGTTMEASVENRLQVLDDYPEILTKLVGFAKNSLNFTAIEKVEEEVKN